MAHQTSDNHPPEVSAGVVSHLLFGWLSSLLSIGYSRPLQSDDLWDLPEYERVDVLLSQYNAAFVDAAAQQRATLRRVLLRMVWRPVVISGALTVVYIGCQVALPILLRLCVQSVDKRSIEGAGYAVGLALAVMVGAVANQHALHLCFRMAQRLRAVLIAVVYRRALAKPPGLLVTDGAATAAGQADDARKGGSGHGHGPTEAEPGAVNGHAEDADVQPSTTTGRGFYVSQGRVATLLASDTGRVFDVLPLVHFLWASPLLIAVSTGFLISYLGPASLAGIAVLVLMVPIQSAVARGISSARKIHTSATDERVRLLSELLSGARVVKLNGWERAFGQRMLALRQKEDECIWRENRLFALQSTFAIIAPVAAMVATFAAFTLSGHDQSAADSFAALAFFNVIRFPVTNLSQVVTSAVQLHVSLGRMEEFLGPGLGARGLAQAPGQGQAGEIQPAAIAEQPSTHGQSSPPSAALVHLEHASFAWPADDGQQDKGKGKRGKPERATKPQASGTSSELASPGSGTFAVSSAGDSSAPRSSVLGRVNFALTDLHFRVSRGSCTVVTGPVAAGKSSLLAALLGEMPRVLDSSIDTAAILQPATPGGQQGGAPGSAAGPPGVYSARGLLQGARVAYAPQVPWILAGTLRDNVVFGSPWDEDRYTAVMESCCLWEDCDALSAGDLTTIGERGVTLSGGQKARVGLARAAYARPDLLLADDPLSALDAQTGERVWSRLLGRAGLLQQWGIARMVVSHASMTLPQADNILVLYEGRTVFQGIYAELTRLYGAGSGNSLPSSSAISGLVAPGTYGQGQAHGHGQSLHEAPHSTQEAKPKERSTVSADSFLRALAAAHGGAGVGSPGLRPRTIAGGHVATAVGLGDAGTGMQALSLQGATVDAATGIDESPVGASSSNAAADRAAVDAAAAVEDDLVALEGEDPGLTSPKPGVRLAGSDATASGSTAEAAVSHGDASTATSGQPQAGTSPNRGPRAKLATKADTLTVAEDRAIGSVSMAIYWAWYKAGGGVPMLLVLLVGMIYERLTYIGTDFWLAAWTAAAAAAHTSLQTANTTGVTVGPSASSSGPQVSPTAAGLSGLHPLPVADSETRLRFWLAAYVAWGTLNSIGAVWRMFAISAIATRASRGLFVRSLWAVLRAPMQWIETTPLGRIVNRLSSDVDTVDVVLLQKMNSSVASTFWIASSLGVIIAVVPWMVLVLAPVLVVYRVVQRYFQFSVRELQRLESLSRSPLQAHFGESLAGAATIRSFGPACVQRFVAQADGLLDTNNKALLAYNSSTRWLATRLESLGAIIILSVALLSWAAGQTGSGLPGGYAGLALLWATNLVISFNFNVVFVTETEARMVAVERLVSYADGLEREQPLDMAAVDAGQAVVAMGSDGAATKVVAHATAASTGSSRARANTADTLREIFGPAASSKTDGDDDDGTGTPRVQTDTPSVRRLTSAPEDSVPVAVIPNPLYPAGRPRGPSFADAMHETPAPSHKPVHYKPRAWPNSGQLVFRNVWLKYRPGLPWALRGASFTTKPGEYLAVVGRTGSGKSTLAAALFRLVDDVRLLRGAVLVDGIDVRSVGLQAVRGAPAGIAIIPQEPLLFTGTLRFNLDPTGRFAGESSGHVDGRGQPKGHAKRTGTDPDEDGDGELWRALELVRLAERFRPGSSSAASASVSAVTATDAPAPGTSEGKGRTAQTGGSDGPRGLDTVLREDSLSQGERQLLCLARAMLTKPRLLLLDEATASVDAATDALMHAMVRQCFTAQGCTVVSVAHRLSSVVAADRVLVLERGQVVELGTPVELLQRPARDIGRAADGAGGSETEEHEPDEQLQGNPGAARSTEKPGTFTALVEASGPTVAARLRQAAHTAALKKAQVHGHGQGH